MKTAELRRLAVSLHRDSGRIVELGAQNTGVSARTLSQFLSFVEETAEVALRPVQVEYACGQLIAVSDSRSSVYFCR